MKIVTTLIVIGLFSSATILAQEEVVNDKKEQVIKIKEKIKKDIDEDINKSNDSKDSKDEVLHDTPDNENIETENKKSSDDKKETQDSNNTTINTDKKKEVLEETEDDKKHDSNEEKKKILHDTHDNEKNSQNDKGNKKTDNKKSSDDKKETQDSNNTTISTDKKKEVLEETEDDKKHDSNEEKKKILHDNEKNSQNDKGNKKANNKKSSDDKKEVSRNIEKIQPVSKPNSILGLTLHYLKNSNLYGGAVMGMHVPFASFLKPSFSFGFYGEWKVHQYFALRVIGLTGLYDAKEYRFAATPNDLELTADDQFGIRYFHLSWQGYYPVKNYFEANIGLGVSINSLEIPNYTFGSAVGFEFNLGAFRKIIWGLELGLNFSFNFWSVTNVTSENTVVSQGVKDFVIGTAETASDMKIQVLARYKIF